MIGFMGDCRDEWRIAAGSSLAGSEEQHPSHLDEGHEGGISTRPFWGPEAKRKPNGVETKKAEMSPSLKEKISAEQVVASQRRS